METPELAGAEVGIVVERTAEEERSRNKKDTIKLLQKKYHGILIQANDLQKYGKKDFCKWLSSIAKYNNINRTMLLFLTDPNKNDVKAIFFTSDNYYSISATDKYLGCIASSRKELPGECWTRGNDLPDGPYSKETFDMIVNAIIRYEMKNLQCW